jgi:filamentous hemagglutinin family protein
MAYQHSNRCWSIRVLIVGEAIAQCLLGLSLTSNPVLAQITPDNTLGEERSQVTRDVIVRGERGDRIDGGARRDANLFHSFQNFNINEGQRVYFANPVGVENILGRVIGNDVSDIMGTLGVDGGANLYLINPNGIIFGENARLDVSGSFLVSTGNSFTFADRSEFSAINPQGPPLLSVNVPIGIQYGTNSAGSINSRGTLSVNPGQSLILLGGAVNLQDSGLFAPSGRVELGGLIGSGTVEVKNENAAFSLVFPSNAARSNVNLTNGSEINVAAEEGGSIAINAQNINLQNSELTAGIAAAQGFSAALSGDIDIIAPDGIVTINNSDIYNQVASRGIGNAGNINITAGSVSITGNRGDVAFLNTDMNGIGSGGDVNIQATDRVTLNRGIITSQVGFQSFPSIAAQGNSGDISITTPLLQINNGGLRTTTAGRGDAGNINIQSSDILFDNDTRIESSVGFNIGFSGAEGNGGDINITTNSLALRNRSQLSAGVFGRGNGGNITITATGAITFDQSDIFGEVDSGLRTAQGNGANINISANSLSLINGSQLFTVTESRGNGGNITIDVADAVVFDGVGDAFGGFTLDSSRPGPSIIQSPEGNLFRSGVFASVEPNSTYPGSISLPSRGGAIDITASSLTLTNGARIVSRTAGQGDAGSVTINAANQTLIDGSVQIDLRGSTAEGELGSAILTSVEPSGIGNGGDITIATERLFLTNGARLSTATNALGSSGSITITGRSLSLTDGSRIQAETNELGAAGNIAINATDSIDISGVNIFGRFSGILTSSENANSGRGGNITINQATNSQGTLHLSNRSFLSARTRSTNDGGNIEVNVNNLLLDTGGQIVTTAATSSSGNAGSITVNATGTTRIQGSGTPFIPTSNPFSGLILFDLNNLEFGTEFNPNVEASGEGGIPYVSIERTSGQLISEATVLGTVEDDAFDYYVFSVTSPNSRGIFDVDYGYLDPYGIEGINTELFIFNRDTGELVTSNLDSDLSNGARGSIGLSGQDSYVSATFEAPGNYVIRVSKTEFNSSGLGPLNELDISDTYTLQVSLENQGEVEVVDFDRFNPNQGVNSGLFAQTDGMGNAGNVTITTPRLSIEDGGGISAASTATGRAGSLNIVASESVSLADNSRLSVEAESDGGGAGNLRVDTRNLSVESGAQITARNQATQQSNNEGSGNITLSGLDILRVNNGLIEASTAIGQAGSITVNAQGGEVELSGTLPNSRQGGLSVRATGAGGVAGELTVRTRRLTVGGGAQISGSVTNGEGGDIIVNATDSVQLSGRNTELSAEASRGGEAGNLTVITNRLAIDDGATASVSSPRGRAGNLNVTADYVLLDDGALTAVTGASGGANINLHDLDLLVMRNGSLISARANEGARGGNVNINLDANDNNYGFIVAIPEENNDIIATAQEGRGGEINITSAGIFGIEERRSFPPNQTNDIDASSEGGPQGVVTINRPNTDPSQSLTGLPTDVVDASTLMAQSCASYGSAASSERSEFIMTGRGVK